jgi:S-adenosylmethionine hydrolase
MPDPLVTLTTDFGEDSPYAAALKGVLLAVNAQARLVDLSHQIPPQDVRHAAFFLAGAVPYFPPGTLHVVVVDPGVGGDRAILYAEAGGQRLLMPDNGCWTLLPGADRATVRRLVEPAYWRHPVSATFHGRDIFAPVAGHLSRGLDPQLLGPPVPDWVRLAVPAAEAEGGTWHGEVVFVDHFGNLITNIPADRFSPPTAADLRAQVGGTAVTPRWVRTYAEVGPGTLVALFSSSGTLEIAVPHGSAAARLGAGVGAPVTVYLEAGERTPSPGPH